MASAKETVNKIIAENKAVVFAKTTCPLCANTKKTLDQLGATYTTVDLDTREDGQDLQSALAEISGQNTVPNIYIKQQHIGGNSDLQDLQGKGELQTRLKDAGAC